MCAIRAAGYCMSFPYNLALLENAHAQLGNQSLAVAGGAIIGLKHLESPSRDRNTATGRGLMQRLWDILQWVQSKGMKPTSQIMVSGEVMLQPN